MGLHQHARRPAVILLTLAILAIIVAVAYPRIRTTKDTATGVRVAVPPQPDWKALTADQRTILAPLKSDWNNMERFRRKKWLEIAARYPNLSETEQERLQDRMWDWASLTPAQRQAARERFKEISQRTSPEEREALAQKWMDYQDLPEEVRQRIEKDALDKERASKRAAGTPAVDGKPTPISTKEGALPSGSTATTLATGSSNIKVVPPKPARPVSPLTFAPARPAEDTPPAVETPAIESR